MAANCLDGTDKAGSRPEKRVFPSLRWTLETCKVWGYFFAV